MSAATHRMMALTAAGFAAGLLGLAEFRGGDASAQTAANVAALKTVSDFDGIQDRNARAIALFQEAGKVILSPRCMNCHPAGEHPLQGADHHEHRPKVWRNDTGSFGTPCGECHTEKNVTLHEAATYKSIPGHPRWGVAPLSMAWE
ncbi:MAG TPA: Isoquinoline 1-oxidoreductase subunit, partial [Xanthobacteraceae bacterium]